MFVRNGQKLGSVLVEAASTEPASEPEPQVSQKQLDESGAAVLHKQQSEPKKKASAKKSTAKGAADSWDLSSEGNQPAEGEKGSEADA